jgi:simple sugar transport system ATP-binding protein
LIYAHLGRWCPRLANQPTRGLDVGSIEYIHRQIVDMRNEGAGVLLISAELEEITALSDRIAVMYHGEIVGEMPAAEATRQELGMLMCGVKIERPREAELTGS